MNERDMHEMYETRPHHPTDGGYMSPSRGRGRGRGRGRRRTMDRGMGYGYDMRGDMRYDMRGDMRGYMPPTEYGGEYHGDRMERREYEDMRGMDGHHMHGGRSGGYEPVEFMGYCSGYYGSPDYGRGRDYGYDMRYRRDYGYDYGDYGETLSDRELDHWEHKLLSQLDDREKQMFHKDAIMQKAKSMGRPMEGFGEKELYVATIMVYTDFKHDIGQNADLAVKLAYDWLADKDVTVKGAEKLAVYYDCIVEGED